MIWDHTYHCSRNPRKCFVEKNIEEDFTRNRGIPQGIFEDMFDHLVIIFKLLVSLSNKFNDLIIYCMRVLLNNLFWKIFEYQISELRSFLKDPNWFIFIQAFFNLEKWLICNTYLIISPLHINKYILPFWWVYINLTLRKIMHGFQLFSTKMFIYVKLEYFLQDFHHFICLIYLIIFYFILLGFPVYFS